MATKVYVKNAQKETKFPTQLPKTGVERNKQPIQKIKPAKKIISITPIEPPTQKIKPAKELTGVGGASPSIKSQSPPETGALNWLLPKGGYFDKRINLAHEKFEPLLFHFQEIASIFEKDAEVGKNSPARKALRSINFAAASHLKIHADDSGNQTLITTMGKKEVQLAEGKEFTSLHISDGKNITHILRRNANTEVIHFS